MKKRYPISFREVSWRVPFMIVALVCFGYAMFMRWFSEGIFFVLGVGFCEYLFFFLYKFRIFTPETWWKEDKEDGPKL